MNSSKKICVVTGTRADYGLLLPLIRKISEDSLFELQIVATGSHLSPQFGLTYKEIETDGFTINSKVEILTRSDSAVGVLSSMALGLVGISSALSELKPDLIVALGDRYELMVTAQVALMMQIPLAHLSGGDTGSGTYDNTIRHCVTKIASLHFVTHEDARQRVLQLGEREDRVFCLGSTCVENIKNTPLLSREELEESLGVTLQEKLFLVTHHPLTMGDESSEDELRELLNAIQTYLDKGNVSVVFTKANADNGGQAINQILEEFSSSQQNAFLFDSLGRVRYLSAVKHAAVVIGNSSSGIYEAPYLNTPTVDIGLRQSGRAAPTSVIRSAAISNDICRAVDRALIENFDGVQMIYGDGNTSGQILAKIKEMIGVSNLSAKEFVDREIK